MMAKKQINPSTILSPVPVVLVSCRDENGYANATTIAWTGTINSEPPMLYVSIRKSRYAHEIISRTGEFVVNLISEKILRETDFCGVKSGRDMNKFKEMKFTEEKSRAVSAPGIAESPVTMECKVKQVIELGSHDAFLAEIVGVNVEEVLMDENGKIHLDKADLVAYSHGEYYGLGECLGFFGYSVAKSDKVKRPEAKIAVEENKKNEQN